MLRSEAISIIKRGLGFRTTQDTAIIAALQEAQRTLELGRTLPEFLLSYDAAIAVTAGDANVALPTRFIRFHDEYEMYYVNADLARVYMPRRNDVEAYTAYVADGTSDDSALYTATAEYPSVVVKRGKTAAVFYPTPTQSFTAYLTCYVGAELLTSDVENAWLKYSPDILIAIAGDIVAGNLRDKGALEEFRRRGARAGASHLGDIIEDELAGRGLIMGRNN